MHGRWILYGAALLLCSSATPERVHAGENDCERANGTFSSFLVPPGPACASPVGVCTLGTLSGDLVGSYAFTMLTMVPSQLFPGAFEYTGQSVITTADGQIVGRDQGLFFQSQTGPSTLIATLTITGGSGELAGASGGLGIHGTVDFTTGVATGVYRGQVCTPDDDDDHHHHHHHRHCH